jgi:nucleoside-diphosphate kinase
MERTLILIKPDGVERKLTGEILRRFETRGFSIVAMKMLTPSEEIAKKHYAEHESKPFFGSLVEFLSGSALVALVLEAPDAIALARKTIGATKPIDSAPGTIRGDLTVHLQQNLVHGSDSPESAERELKLWFPELN